MTEESAAEEEVEEESEPVKDFIFMDVMEGGSVTVVLDEDVLKARGIVALHVCGGSMYALMASDWKLHKLEEVKGMPASASVRAIRATKPE